MAMNPSPSFHLLRRHPPMPGGPPALNRAIKRSDAQERVLKHLRTKTTKIRGNP